MSTSTRNAEISRRRLAGERPLDLAAEFGVSPERIWQIVQAEQRLQRGEPANQRRRNVTPGPAAVRPTIRPRLRLWPDRPAGEDWWECVSGMRRGVGATQPEEYAQWLGKGPGVASTEPPTGATSTATPRPLPRMPALTPVHACQVQVLPGPAERKPLSFASRLGLNLERIGKAQPPIQRLADATSPRAGGFHDQD